MDNNFFPKLLLLMAYDLHVHDIHVSSSNTSHNSTANRKVVDRRKAHVDVHNVHHHIHRMVDHPTHMASVQPLNAFIYFSQII